MDTLSDILALLKPRTVQTYGIVSGGVWALNLPRGYQGVKFGAVARGECWLKVRDVAQPIRLNTGDCFLLTGQPYWLGSDTSLPGDDSSTIFVDPITRIGRVGPSNETFVVGGRLTFDESHAVLLTGALPPVMHIPASSDEAAVLRWTLDQLARELTDARPGSLLFSEHLGQILFVNVLRAHMIDGENNGPGWLRGLADPRISRVLRAVHAKPALRWTLEMLAGEAGMSRTAFALHFKSAVGWSPIGYVLRWRMRLAARTLSTSRASLAELARSLGYESETAFSTAFRRVMGCTPKQYKAQVRRTGEAQSR
jgi:AraC-like DNA-binding protein